MRARYSHARGSAVVRLTAVVAVIFLVGAILYSIDTRYHDAGTLLSASSPLAAASARIIGSSGSHVATDTLPAFAPTAIALLLANYDALKQQGSLSSSSITTLGAQVAEATKPSVYFEPVATSSIAVDQDTSYQRVLTYRSDLQAALNPSRKNTDPEIALISAFEESHDPLYLTKLRQAAVNYDEAASHAATMVVPSDAVAYHIAAINSLREFGATINAFADYATDTITSIALLSLYNKAEQDVTSSFDTLAQYFSEKNHEKN